MHTGEGPAGGADRQNGREREAPQKIGVGSNDDSIARIQLAARWAEAYPPVDDDSLASVLRRFRTAFEYLDAITHGVEPPDLEPERERAPAPAPAPPPQPASTSYSTPSYAPPPPSGQQSMPSPPPPPPTSPEPRPWS
jgi:hypothetical protein